MERYSGISDRIIREAFDEFLAGRGVFSLHRLSEDEGAASKFLELIKERIESYSGIQVGFSDLLGGGTYGTVWRLPGGDKVLKIQFDPVAGRSEIDVAEKIMSLQEEVDTGFVEVFDAGVFEITPYDAPELSPYLSDMLEVYYTIMAFGGPSLADVVGDIFISFTPTTTIGEQEALVDAEEDFLDILLTRRYGRENLFDQWVRENYYILEESFRDPESEVIKPLRCIFDKTTAFLEFYSEYGVVDYWDWHANNVVLNDDLLRLIDLSDCRVFSDWRDRGKKISSARDVVLAFNCVKAAAEGRPSDFGSVEGRGNVEGSFRDTLGRAWKYRLFRKQFENVSSHEYGRNQIRIYIPSITHADTISSSTINELNEHLRGYTIYQVGPDMWSYHKGNVIPDPAFSKGKTFYAGPDRVVWEVIRSVVNSRG